MPLLVRKKPLACKLIGPVDPPSDEVPGRKSNASLPGRDGEQRKIGCCGGVEADDVSRSGGEQRFIDGKSWATQYARYTALALGRDTIRVDVAAYTIGY